jgi:hypothetical protein
MLGLDSWVAGFSDGTTLLVVGLVASVIVHRRRLLS